MSGAPLPETSSPPSPIAMTAATHQRVVIIFAGTICLVLVMIVGVLCFRVALDGDSAITQQITSQLVGIVPWLAGSLVAAVVGVNGIASIIASKMS